MDERLQICVDERLQRAAAEGDVDALFSILAEDPLVLERIDEKPFLSTPLHTAVREGKIQFAKEIVNLRPSFVYKRDHLGRSPLHLALEWKHQEIERHGPFSLDLEEKYQEHVTWLIKHDSELVHVKAKGRVTPLHYAAQIDDESSLADFLYVCPSSIKDLTVKCEAAVHVAVKNWSFRALKVLLESLPNIYKEDILSCKDEEGNNALHTAISKNQHEAVELLIRYMKVNEKNSQGLTALDIIYDRADSLDEEVGKPNTILRILLGAEAKRASELRPPLKSELAKLLIIPRFSGGLKSCVEKIKKALGHGYQTTDNIPLEVRNALLVVATLIATATYQAALSPAGGLWQDLDEYGSNENNTVTSKKANMTLILNGLAPSPQIAGHMIQGSVIQLACLALNSLAFSFSMTIILVLINGLPFSRILRVSSSLISGSFAFAMLETFPYSYDSFLFKSFFSLIYLSFILIVILDGFYVHRKNKFYEYGKKRQLRPGEMSSAVNLYAHRYCS